MLSEARLKEIARKLYEIGAVRIGSFKLSSGKVSPYYLDLRIALSEPSIVQSVAEQLREAASDIQHDVVVGVATAGIAWAAILAFLENKPLAYVRSEKKGYGLGKLVEGLVSGKKALIVDDVATTGGSVLRAASAVKEAGGEPVAVLVIIDREEGARSSVESQGLKFKSLIRASELFKALMDEELISGKDYSLVMNYIKGGL